MIGGIFLDNTDEINEILREKVSELEQENYALKQSKREILKDYAELINELNKIKEMISFI